MKKIVMYTINILIIIINVIAALIVLGQSIYSGQVGFILLAILFFLSCALSINLLAKDLKFDLVLGVFDNRMRMTFIKHLSPLGISIYVFAIALTSRDYHMGILIIAISIIHVAFALSLLLLELIMKWKQPIINYNARNIIN